MLLPSSLSSIKLKDNHIIITQTETSGAVIRVRMDVISVPFITTLISGSELTHSSTSMKH